MSDAASSGADTQGVSTGGTGQPEDARIRPNIAALYCKHRRLMREVAFRVLGPSRRDQVEDVVHEAWSKVQQQFNKPTSTDPDNWEAWLSKITTNCALTEIKKDNTYNKYVEKFQQTAAPPPSSERPGTRRASRIEHDPVADQVIAASRAHRLRALLADLPEDEHTMVHLKFFEGYSYATIGPLLNTPRSGQSVGQVVNRVLKELAQKLGGEAQ